MRKIWIDCDPGIDDAVAIKIAHNCKNAEIVGLSSVFGNTDLKHCHHNAQEIADSIGLNVVPVMGAEEPMIKIDKGETSLFHGADGFGGHASDKEYPAAKEHAWDAIYKAAKQYSGELEIVTLGPLTNLAIAILRYEDLYSLIKAVYIMGGSCGIGNETAFAEANVIRDAYASEVVFSSGIEKIVMVGLDATEQTRLDEEEFQEFYSRHVSKDGFFAPLINYYKEKQKKSGEKGLVIHDAAAMFCALYPEDMDMNKYYVHTELDENLEYGRTVADKRLHSKEIKNVFTVEKINKEAYKKVLSDTFS